MCITEHSTFTVPVTCTNCGGDVYRINESSFAGTELLAVVKCHDCKMEFSLGVYLRKLKRNPLAAERKREQRAREKAHA